MPELPEVETIKNSLNAYLQGDILLDIVFKRKDIITAKGDSVDYTRLINQKLNKVDRHGKYLLFYFSDDLLMIIHLRMTGKLLYLPALDAAESDYYLNNKHTHIIFNFNSGQLLFNDIRRFGKISFCKISPETSISELLNSGPDALSADFNPDYMAENLHRHSKKPIKNVLLDQKDVAGIGNIYADESLFHAGIRPDRPAASLTPNEINRLYQSILVTLNSSIESGGTTFRDYRTATNHKGSFQNKLYVYGRADEECLICHNKLSKLKLSGRTTVFCPHCQK